VRLRQPDEMLAGADHLADPEALGRLADGPGRRDQPAALAADVGEQAGQSATVGRPRRAQGPAPPVSGGLRLAASGRDHAFVSRDERTPPSARTKGRFAVPPELDRHARHRPGSWWSWGDSNPRPP